MSILNSGELKSPFLALPIEIRRLIFSYFVPDANIWINRRTGGHAAPRKDGGSICPAMMRVNRQIHTELSLEWYSRALFQVSSSKESEIAVVDYLGVLLSPGDQLPWQLQLVKNLKLDFSLVKYKEQEPASTSRQNQQQIDHLDALVSLLCVPEARLENLMLQISIPWGGLMGRMRRYPELIPELMEFRLHSLRRFRGLQNVIANVTKQKTWSEMCGGPEEPGLDIDDWSYEFLDPLYKEMMEPKSV